MFISAGGGNKNDLKVLLVDFIIMHDLKYHKNQFSNVFTELYSRCDGPSPPNPPAFMSQPDLTRAAVSSGVVMSERDVIDFPALEKELQAAVESERRYQRENQAKLRAVKQGVGYDQFRWVPMETQGLLPGEDPGWSETACQGE